MGEDVWNFFQKHPTCKSTPKLDTSRNRSLQHFASIAEVWKQHSKKRPFESIGFCWLPHMETKHTPFANQVPWCFTVSTGRFPTPLLLPIGWKQPSDSIIEVVSLLGAFEGTDPEVEPAFPTGVLGGGELKVKSRKTSRFGIRMGRCDIEGSGYSGWNGWRWLIMAVTLWKYPVNAVQTSDSTGTSGAPKHGLIDLLSMGHEKARPSSSMGNMNPQLQCSSMYIIWISMVCLNQKYPTPFQVVLWKQKYASNNHFGSFCL